VNDLGRTALVGLTLLECGATGDDPLVRQIADRVRDQCAETNRVYNLTLAILLFDRLGDDRDVPLLQAMAVRLLGAPSKGARGRGVRAVANARRAAAARPGPRRAAQTPRGTRARRASGQVAEQSARQPDRRHR